MKKLYWVLLISFVVFTILISCKQEEKVEVEVELAAEPIEISSVEDTSVESTYKDVVEFVFVTPEPYTGPILNAYVGTVEGPSGKETYYNLPMDYVVYLMRELGYGEEEYPYWEREDGCKMFGPYIMCAAALDIRPKGTILESSLGTCIVCDTGEFVEWNHTQIDIAVNW